MNRRLLKDESRRLIKTGQPKPMIAAVIFIALTLVISMISGKLISQPLMESIGKAFPELFEFSITDGTFRTGFDYSVTFDITDPETIDKLMDAIQDGMPSAGADLIYTLLSILTVLIEIGFLIFTLNIAMGAEASYWNILDGFPMILRVLWLKILKGIFVFLWSLLFFFPGIIAAYSFRQAEYLLVQHPEMKVRDCLRESKRLMKGHKWELFVLDLSFIGWALLIGLASSITLWSIPIIAVAIRIWYLPFLYITRALYYKELTYVPPEEEWTPEF